MRDFIRNRTLAGFIVAKAYSATSESADELAALLTEASGATTRRSELPGLDGPNHAIQILADIPTWAQMAAVYLSGKVIEGFISQFGAEAASKLIAKFKPSLPPKGDDNLDAEALAKSINKIAIDNRDSQTLTIAIPMPTNVMRNFGLDLSEHLNGDSKHDSLLFLRGVVALVLLAQRMQRQNLVPMYPQNRDCSVAVHLQEDGCFGGTYECLARQNSSISTENSNVSDYVEPGSYRLTLKFNAAGECLKDDLENLS